MLRRALSAIDLARATVIVTADHGHVASGGHGGSEREVSNVPLVLAGRGIVPGATARDAQLIDVAPTVAALLGIPAPRHAEGRALVELLQLSPEEAARRTASDAARSRVLAELAGAARARVARPAPAPLLVLATGLALASVLALMARRRGAIALTPAATTGALGFAVTVLAVVALTRGHMSPSYVPSLARTVALGAFSVVVALLVQLIASWRVVRSAPDRLAAANGLGLVGLGLALGTVTLVRAWFSPPHLDVPPPFWMVAIPALDLAAATCALGTALTLMLAVYRRAPAAPRFDEHR